MKRLFKGGTVVSGERMQELDLLVKGEKILAVGKDLSFRDAEIVDVKGKYLFPGFIDAHTHMALDVSNTTTADGFYTGTKAELAGGTTCIIDFATQYAGESLAQALENWHRKADGESSCDYAFHLALYEWNDEISRELEKVVREEVSSFKLYIYNIFHNMRFLYLSKAYKGISNTYISKIILFRCFNIFFTFYIITFCTFY